MEQVSFSEEDSEQEAVHQPSGKASGETKPADAPVLACSHPVLVNSDAGKVRMAAR